MKRFVYLFLCIVLYSLCSCKDGVKKDVSVIQEVDTLALDSIKRDSIFEARGDTIFANVLYGMSKQEAEQSIKQFQETLKYPIPNRQGFIFGDIHFMDINVSDFSPSTSVDRYYGAYLWKGKLSSVTWSSYSQYANSKGRIEYVLNDFIKFFENRFGKPNFKNTESSYWLWSDKGRPRFLNRDLAIWETNKRMIVIGIKGEKTPMYDESYYELDSQEREYVYSIKVSFFDKKSYEEMEACNHEYIEELGKENRERQKNDSIKSMNSL